MIFTETPIPGAYLVDIKPIGDPRGFFARTFCTKEFEDHGLNPHFVQANMSYGAEAGTLRGLHYQTDPAPETKFIRCTAGAIFDVIVDLREGSATRGHWYGAELTPENRRAMYVPQHFAHGFLSLKPDTEVHYLVGGYYTPEAERGLRWDDPSLGIEWPMEPKVISDKDKAWPDMS